MIRNNHYTLLFCCCLVALCTLQAVAQSANNQGIASYYNDGLHGRRTASGERYDKRAFTCASLDYPIGSVLRVTRVDNGKSVDVRVNDCGPHRADRIIDLSKAAALEIGLIRDGLASVKVELIMPGEGKMPCGGPLKNTTLPDATTTPPATTPPATAPSQSAVIIPAAHDKNNPNASGSTQGPKIEPLPPAEPPVMPSEGTLPASALKPLTSGFAVQIGSFVNYENATRLSALMEDKGFQNVLIGNKGNVFRVMLGPFNTKEEAQRYAQSLQQQHDMKSVLLDLSEN